MKIKRIAAAVLAAVMVVMTMAMTVSAESIFSSSKSIDSGKKVTKTLDRGEALYYKFTPASKGTAKIKITAEVYSLHFYVYDEDGNDVAFKKDIPMGEEGSNTKYYWKDSAETFKGTFSFSVAAKKTYYVKIDRGTDFGDEHYGSAGNGGTGKFEISFSYPTTTKADDTLLFTYTLKKGKTVQFGATDADAKWSTSNKSVATVSSKGVIKGVKKGEAIITIKSGSQTQKIKIIVTA